MVVEAEGLAARLESSSVFALLNEVTLEIVTPLEMVFSELRIHFGPGYRVYFSRIGDVVYVLLCGGTKRGQQRDIAKAQALARQLKED